MSNFPELESVRSLVMYFLFPQDILAYDDKLLHRKLDLFRKRDNELATLGHHQAEAAHNLQVRYK